VIWRRLGYVEGETVLVRSAEGDPKRLPELVKELIRSDVGVLIVVGGEAVRAASEATSTTPIVAIDLETDPVRAGLAASFSRPGENVTGLFLDQPSLAGKWIDLLREVSPAVERVALFWSPTTGHDQLDIATGEARRRGLDTIVIEERRTQSLEAEFEQPPSANTGIVVLSIPGFYLLASAFAAAAQRRRLPSVAFLTAYARSGVLMSYGPDQQVYFPRAMVLVEKIMHGASPGDLPIERPDRFQLAINMKTASAMRLTVPTTLLAQADEVIE